MLWVKDTNQGGDAVAKGNRKAVSMGIKEATFHQLWGVSSTGKFDY